MNEVEDVALDEDEEDIELGIIETIPLIQWIQLPNNEPAVVVGMFDAFGELTNDTEEAVRLTAKDRFGRINLVNVTNDLVNKEVVLQ